MITIYVILYAAGIIALIYDDDIMADLRDLRLENQAICATCIVNMTLVITGIYIAIMINKLYSAIKFRIIIWKNRKTINRMLEKAAIEERL